MFLDCKLCLVGKLALKSMSLFSYSPLPPHGLPTYSSNGYLIIVLENRSIPTLCRYFFLVRCSCGRLQQRSQPQVSSLNTAVESLSNGVPMVAIPIANDRPGVAARIAWTGTGEVITLGKLTSSRLQAAVQQVLTEDTYKKNVIRLQAAMRGVGGASRAADIVERVAQAGQPALA
jgi:hypothetical protein